MLCHGQGSCACAWGGAPALPIYAGSTISSTLDHLFVDEIAAGRMVSNVSTVAILSALKVGGELFAVIRVGVAISNTEDMDHPIRAHEHDRVALIALDRSGPDAVPLFPTMSAAQWLAAGAFSDARVVPLGDELVCVFSNGMAANLRQAIAPPGGAARSFEFLSTSPQDISGLTFIGASSPCGVRSNKVPEFPAFEGQAQ